MSLPSGIILLNKAAGLTSQQAINRIKKKFQFDKIGHTGTLDPDATGLLVVLVNKATRLARFIESGVKRYTGIIKLGVKTTTDDLSGQIIAESTSIPNFDQIEKAAPSFIGEILQVPPQVSSVHVAGERSHEIVRRGGQVTLEARKITIYKFEIKLLSDSELEYVIECSKGCYIRSIARDLGDKLGCGGAVKSISREYSAPFCLSDAKSEEQLCLADIIPIRNIFRGDQMLALTDPEAKALSNGLLTPLKRFNLTSAPAVLGIVNENSPDNLVGVIEQVNGRWQIAVNL